MTAAQLALDVLRIEPATVVSHACEAIRRIVGTVLNRRGLVVGISGGIDSAVVTHLAARALGPERVYGLLMPERHSSTDTLELSRAVAASAGVRTELEEITALLEAA